MDYCLPRAHDLIPFELERNEIPCLSNPLGVKGCGEAGTVAASPSVMNAVVNALAELGVRHVDMPATPERVWRAIQDAKYSTSLIR
jgi:carbon-monoxide dehydrogenase large subunit